MARIKIHEQVRQQIEQFILDKALGPGGRLPSETDLAAMFKVSRSTVRNALRSLEQEGKIERTPGRGTIVCQARFGRLAGKLTGFTEEMKLRGLKPTSRLVEVTRITPSAPVKALLQLDSEAVWELKRVRCADNEPIAVETCYISCALLGDKEITALKTGSLYDLLEHRGRAPVTSEQTIEAALATPDDAVLLNIEPGRPVLQFERLSFDEGGQPVEFVVSTYRGDKHRISVLLRK